MSLRKIFINYVRFENGVRKLYKTGDVVDLTPAQEARFKDYIGDVVRSVSPSPAVTAVVEPVVNTVVDVLVDTVDAIADVALEATETVDDRVNALVGSHWRKAVKHIESLTDLDFLTLITRSTASDAVVTAAKERINALLEEVADTPE